MMGEMHGSLLIAPVDNDGWLLLLLLASFVYVRVYDMRFCSVCVCVCVQTLLVTGGHGAKEI
jgi:hypothetical protein